MSALESDTPIAAWCDDECLHVKLADGRKIATPLTWYPLLRGASHAVRNTFELSPFGIHWPDLDEDLSIEGMLKGARYPVARQSVPGTV